MTAEKDLTVLEVFETFTDDQREYLYYIVTAALKYGIRVAKHLSIVSDPYTYVSLDVIQKKVFWFLVGESVRRGSSVITESS